MPARPPRPCSKCGQRASRGGMCSRHYRQADKRRGTSSQRGYDVRHRDRFRAGVLARDAICVDCDNAAATVADHYPLTRRQLVARGLDPNDPKHGRGLCETCHNRHTALTNRLGA